MKNITEPYTDTFSFGINMKPKDDPDAPTIVVEVQFTGHTTRQVLLMALDQLYNTQLVPMAQANLVAENEAEFYALLTPPEAELLHVPDEQAAAEMSPGEHLLMQQIGVEPRPVTDLTEEDHRA